MEPINDFRGEYRWLSNYYVIPITMPDGITYSSTEAAYQAQKTLDMDKRNAMAQMSPNDSKRAGRQIELRENWNDMKDALMLDILRIKFADPEMRRMLLETGDTELIEGNYWHDNHFGSCWCDKCGYSGENVLGKLLMKVRDEIRN